ncbi:MAG: polysaccharide biosynthesis protein [Kiritimatiellae bacterium]|nr:polysaccharide biosynthesis protein [Kiritimatiellia bacterium]
MRRDRKAWLEFIATRLFGACVDAALVTAGYFAAFALRFDFGEPSWGWRAVAQSCEVVVLVHLAALLATGCYRLAWRRVRPSELPRYLGATALAAATLTAMRYTMPSVALAHIRPPYSITLISFVFSTLGIIGARVLWRAYMASRQRDEALMRRDERHFDNRAAAGFLLGKTVMVTGAGGSIGSEIVRQVAAAGAERILLVERCEKALYDIEREMRGSAPLPPSQDAAARFVPIMADIADRDRISRVLARYSPKIILHAAAYKHVPMVELNPDEGRRNNVDGTKALAELAVAAGVERFVLISTDKAVNPVSVMGRTKREAEKAIMSQPPSCTSFCAVRFGNVLGSSGSVVPLFREQIAAGGPVTVTHPDMRRYFMTVQEAVSLVLQAASRSEHAIYTLDMGKSVRILDLAEDMIAQAGFRPYVDIPIVFTGIRPGEKLFEELDVSEKSCFRTDMAKIYITKQEEEK